MFLKLVALLLCITYVAYGDEVHDHDSATENSVTLDDENVKFENCTDVTVDSTILRVKVSGCKSSDTECALYRGTNHSVRMTFEPKARYENSTLQMRVYGVFEKFKVPYGKRTTVCTEDDIHSEINVQSCSESEKGNFHLNRNYTYVSNFAVSTSYPTLSLKVRFDLRLKKHATSLLCLQIPVNIMDPPTTETNEV